MNSNSSAANTNEDAATAAKTRSPRTLRSQLVWAVSAVMVVAFVAQFFYDYRRELDAQVVEEFGSLESDATIHHEAILRLREQGDQAIQRYLDAVGNRPLDSYSRRHKHIMVVCVRANDVLVPAGHPDASKLREVMIAAAGAPDHRGVFENEELIVGSFARGDLTVYVADYVANLRGWLLKDLYWRAFGNLIFGLLLVAIINGVLFRLITRPLERLVGAVQEIGQGKLGTQAGEFRCQELNRLASTINSMSVSLAEADRENRLAMAKAQRIQRHLLPQRVRIPGLLMEYLYAPATEVAGDYFDVIPLPDGSWLLCIADVTGHGVPAAMTAAMLKALLLHAAERHTQPDAILQFINQRFTALCLPDDFASMFLARWSPSEKLLEFASAGHEPCLLISANNAFQFLHSTGSLLGIGDDSWTTTRQAIAPGDRLALLTDGVPEAMGPAGPFGRKRLAAHFQKHRHSALASLIATLQGTLQEHLHGQPQHDDWTLLVIEFESVAS